MIKKVLTLSTSLALATALFGTTAMAAGSAPHWSYEGHAGPAHWGELSPEFKTCGMGKMQSPVDLANANATSGVEISYDYKPVGLNIINNGHTVQFNVGNGSSMTSHGKKFNLLQVHFHTPSEHPVSGKPYAMEAHFVHKAADGSLAVIGLFFNEGAENEALKNVIKNAPKGNSHGAHDVAGVTVDIRSILPANPSYYRYMGSLTTPPCSEGVNWFLVTKPVTASAQQIAAITAAIGGENARPAQAANNRLILDATK